MSCGVPESRPDATGPLTRISSADVSEAQTSGGPASAAGALVFPCSSSQERCWFIDSLNPGNAALNVALRWEINGRFNPATIEQAFQTIIDRHEILRTRFFEKDGEPMQEVVASYAFKLLVIDLTIIPEAERLDEALALGRREAHLPMDIRRLPLIRVTLLRLSADHAILLVSVHQIAFDGWSIRVLAHEFGAIAAALDANCSPDLPAPSLQYGDYCRWQKEYFASGSFDAEVAYWKGKLGGAPYFELVPDHARPLRPTYRGEILATVLPPELGGRLEEAARQHNMTLFSFACAVTGAMLHRYSGAADVIFGTQIAGRDDPDLETMIGIFINNLVMRFDASGDPTFDEFLTQVNGTVQDALIHQRMPFHKLVEILNPPRDPKRTPLISVNFTVLRDVMDNKIYGGFELSGQPSLSAGSLYDFFFFLVHWPSGWRMAVEYNPDLFERRTAEAMLAFLISAFEFAVATPSARLSALTPPVRDAIAPRPLREDLAAIEALLAAHPDVQQAAVAYRAELGGQGLGGRGLAGAEASYAYVTPAPDSGALLETLPSKLMAYLEKAAPTGNHPSGVSILLALPRTSRGDVDFARLPPPPAPRSAERTPGPAGPSAARLREVEMKLAAIWRDVLGVAEISPDSNFFELGGHSLLTIRLMARVSSAFDVKIDVVTLFQAPTLREFAACLAGSEAPPGPSTVVQIQPKGDKTPILAINNTVLYYNLARRIGTDRPFLGIPLIEPDGPLPETPRSLSEIAADYVRVIREAQAHGPYVLFGLCVAGAIAYEAAQQLARAGESVPLVIMSDIWVPGYLKGLPFFRRFIYHWNYRFHVLRHRIKLVRTGKESFMDILGSYTLIRKSRILDLAAKLRLIKSARVRNVDREDWLFLRTLEVARNHYRTPPSVGDVVVLQSDEVITRFADPNLGWTDLVKGRFFLFHIPGWHEEMFQDEGANRIVEHLQPLLEMVDAERDRSVWRTA
ncbi:condensation domain-containing protein [Methylocapsa aurea]|uniref:condensation domain-containing protein n=1 Tax=Methylocapsa aurea TaxID=663610 RepID=UPI00068E3935|nr:condensation domain-containing protein [Methylocapsa aurea]